jgi:hypothetical protein
MHFENLRKNQKQKEIFSIIFRQRNAKNPTKNPFWIYRCIRYAILFKKLKHEVYNVEC